MLRLDLYQLADPHARSRHETDNEIPELLSVLPQTRFEVFIVRFADDILQKRLLLYFHKLHFPLISPNTFQITVQCTKPQVYSFWLVILDEPNLVFPQLPFCNRIVLAIILLHCKAV